MFRLAADVQVHLHREAIDFRIGINGLAILVEQDGRLNLFVHAAMVCLYTVFRNYMRIGNELSPRVITACLASLVL